MGSTIASLVTFDTRLRSVPTDRAALAAEVRRLQATLPPAARPTADQPADRPTADQPADRPTVGQFREIGCGLLALGRFAEAQAVLGRAVALADESGDARGAIAARVNLGDAHRYAGDLASAEPLYLAALRTARADAPGSVHFALQHLGKHYLDAGRRGEAVRHLAEALALRLALGDQELIESTRATLELAGQTGPCCGEISVDR